MFCVGVWVLCCSERESGVPYREFMYELRRIAHSKDLMNPRRLINHGGYRVLDIKTIDVDIYMCVYPIGVTEICISGKVGYIRYESKNPKVTILSASLLIIDDKIRDEVMSIIGEITTKMLEGEKKQLLIS